MIEVTGLRKSYGEHEALKGISFAIPPGEVVGLLGPNGAGKTTAMKILAGFLLPTEGEARVDGVDVVDRPLDVQRRIGYLPENAPSYGDMLVQDYLAFVADMHGLEPRLRTKRLEATIEECGIGNVLTRTVGHLSKGYRQRLGLAAAILHDPPILILDEPTTGLDPNQIVEVRELIGRMGRSKTVILSTHILPEVEATCGRAIILIDGHVRADGALAELTRSRVQRLTAACQDPADARQRLAALRNVAHVEVDGGGDGFHTFRLHLREDREAGEEVYDLARERGWRVRELRRDDRTLEQVFRELTETAAGEEARA